MTHSMSNNNHFFETLNRVVDHVQQLGYDSQLVSQVLGERGLAAAHGHNYAAAKWYAQCMENGERNSERNLILGCYLREPLDRSQWELVLGPGITADALAAGVIAHGRLQVDIRPVVVASHGTTEVLVVSDPDAAAEVQTGTSDHVPGAGNASMSLLNVIPPQTPDPDSESHGSVTDVLDLGCGSGVLSTVLAANYPHLRVTGTGISSRALAFARAGREVAERGVENKSGDSPTTAPQVEWLCGSWFEPVHGREFDVIVSNPPFVMAPPHRDQAKTYRESGLELDGASALVVGQAPEYLRVGGRAHLLTGWALADGESAAQRVSAWLPTHGVRAWVVQRELVSVADYVTTWLADEEVDTRSGEGRARVNEWLDYLGAHEVERIGMGYVHLERIADSEPSDMTFEVLDQPLPPGTFLGYEVHEWFARMQWLAATDREDLLDSTFAIRPGVAVEHIEVADVEQGQGFTPYALRLSRTEGPAWTHEIDEHVRAVISGLNPEGLKLRDVAGLYCAVHGLDEAAFTDALMPIITDLIRHGFLLPATESA